MRQRGWRGAMLVVAVSKAREAGFCESGLTAFLDFAKAWLRQLMAWSGHGEGLVWPRGQRLVWATMRSMCAASAGLDGRRARACGWLELGCGEVFGLGF